MKERLIELINSYPCMSTAEDNFMESISDDLADYLLANGVVVPPCKVGDTVYVKWRLTRASKYSIYPAKAYALRWDTKKNNFRVCVEGRFEIDAYGGSYTHYYRAAFTWNNVGKTVFLTKEEAVKALKRSEGK